LPELDALVDGVGDADGVGDGDVVGAVGVGAGGFTQQIGFVGFVVRIGLAFCDGRGAGSCAFRVYRPVGTVGTVGSGGRAGSITGLPGVRGERPIPDSAVVAGGTVPAAAGPASRIGTSPFTATR
jgi:hypothetical protein